MTRRSKCSSPSSEPLLLESGLWLLPDKSSLEEVLEDTIEEAVVVEVVVLVEALVEAAALVEAPALVEVLSGCKRPRSSVKAIEQKQLAWLQQFAGLTTEEKNQLCWKKWSNNKRIAKLSEKKHESVSWMSPGVCEHQQWRERNGSLALVEQEKAIAVSRGCQNRFILLLLWSLWLFCWGSNMCQFRFFLETEFDRPRPHMGEDCGPHGRGRTWTSTTMSSTRLRLSLESNF